MSRSIQPGLLVAALCFGLTMTACSFDPGSFAAKDPGGAKTDTGTTTPRDMSPRLDLAASVDQASSDLASPVDMAKGGQPDTSPSQDLSQPPKDMPAPSKDMSTVMPDQALPLPDMAPVTKVCEGVPVDLSTDPMNCGRCGNLCDPTFGVCVQGQCGCQPGLTACGNDNRCEDLAVDPNHCGTCNRACNASSFCSQNTCQCRPGYDSCGGDCVNFKNDPNNCGRCGEVCGSNQVCNEGKCEDRCSRVDLECGHPDGGKACLSRRIQRDDVNFCLPGQLGNRGCGITCGAAELCSQRPGLGLSLRTCRGYRIGRGCANCPCSDCGEGERCTDAGFNLPGVWCVKD